MRHRVNVVIPNKLIHDINNENFDHSLIYIL
jgi:hypothetical protein